MAITTAAQTTAKKETSRSGLQLARIWDQYGMLVIFAILFLLASMLIPNFASMINMKGLGLAVAWSPVACCSVWQLANLICRSVLSWPVPVSPARSLLMPLKVSLWVYWRA